MDIPRTLRGTAAAVAASTLLTLTVVWMLLFGELSLTMALGGVLVGTLIMLVFPLPTVSLGLRLHPVGLAVFLGHFIVDLVVSSARVVAQSFARRPPRSSILAIPLRTRSDLLLTITAICVSVIPGSVIVEVRSGTFTLFVHMLGTDVDAADLLAIVEDSMSSEICSGASASARCASSSSRMPVVGSSLTTIWFGSGCRWVSLKKPSRGERWNMSRTSVWVAGSRLPVRMWNGTPAQRQLSISSVSAA